MIAAVPAINTLSLETDPRRPPSRRSELPAPLSDIVAYLPRPRRPMPSATRRVPTSRALDGPLAQAPRFTPNACGRAKRPDRMAHKKPSSVAIPFPLRLSIEQPGADTVNRRGRRSGDGRQAHHAPASSSRLESNYHLTLESGPVPDALRRPAPHRRAGRRQTLRHENPGSDPGEGLPNPVEGTQPTETVVVEIEAPQPQPAREGDLSGQVVRRAAIRGHRAEQ